MERVNASFPPFAQPDICLQQSCASTCTDCSCPGGTTWRLQAGLLCERLCQQGGASTSLRLPSFPPRRATLASAHHWYMYLSARLSPHQHSIPPGYPGCAFHTHTHTDTVRQNTTIYKVSSIMSSCSDNSVKTCFIFVCRFFQTCTVYIWIQVFGKNRSVSDRKDFWTSLAMLSERNE